MNTYKIIEIDRWGSTDDGDNVSSSVITAANLDEATIKAVKNKWEDDDFTSVSEIEDAIWGEIIGFDRGESCMLQLDEGTEFLIVKVA